MENFYPIHPEQLALETARERLLKKVKEDVNLPTLGAAIAKVIEITSSGDDQVSNLAHFVLSDLALTQKFYAYPIRYITAVLPGYRLRPSHARYFYSVLIPLKPVH